MGLCHHIMARPQGGAGEEGLQMWRGAAKVLDEQSGRADKGRLSSMGFGLGANNSPQ
jgi:hypothetical protein